MNKKDILGNLDAVLVRETQGWYQVNRRNWYNFEKFTRKFKQVYSNEQYLEIIHNKIKF